MKRDAAEPAEDVDEHEASKRVRLDGADDGHDEHKQAEAEPVAEAADEAASDPIQAAPSSSTAEAGSSLRTMIKINGVDKNLTNKDLQKALKKLDIKFTKIKKVFNMSYAEVSFASMEDLDSAFPKLEGFTLRKSTFFPEKVNRDEANAQKLEWNRSRKEKKDDENDTRTPQEKINDQVTPLWRKPYETQLQEKELRFKNSFGMLKKKLLEFLTNRQIPAEKKQALQWLRDLGKERVCPLDEVVPSPLVNGYRTKSEFTFGVDENGEKCVGFLLGLFREGVTTVLPPTDCLNVSDKAKLIAKEMQNHVRTSSLPVYDKMKKEGFWRILQVRTHTTGESMMIVQVHPGGVDKDDMQRVRDELVAKFDELRQANVVDVTTILWQESDAAHSGINETFPMTVLYGPGYVHEELLGLRFRVSPTAFFQVNTEATANLYSRVRDWCALDDISLPPALAGPDAEVAAASTVLSATAVGEDAALPAAAAAASEPPGIVLLDLCCGTGTIGLTMAPSVKRVVGVDLVPAAIEDAQHNAALNGLDAGRTVYIAAKVEDAIRSVFANHVGPRDAVVAVLDPARSGVNSAVIQAVRACEGIDRVVYVSCDFEQAMQNFVDLCRPTSAKFKLQPFRPIRAVPFDLFPHTPHCELLMELRRVK
ncbi:S-adenosyl-L-methionine-dependent methyltransferase [Zopfochytrium polystomum]|nr:S-adenosyl-L-methionine-dependent methyltransferase [Zopfochytrium polystomum]